MRYGLVFMILFCVPEFASSEQMRFQCAENGKLESFQKLGQTFVFASDQNVRNELVRLADAAKMHARQEPCVSGCDDALEAFSGPSDAETKATVQQTVGKIAEVLVAELQKANPSETVVRAHGVQALLRSCEQKPSAETKASRKPANTILLRYDLRGINRNKSGRYDQKDLQRVVEHALIEGVDPFMALSIAMLENAHVGDEKAAEYSGKFGRIPVDNLVLFDSLGCITRTRGLAAVSKEASQKLRGLNDAVEILKAQTGELRSQLQREDKSISREVLFDLEKIEQLKADIKNVQERLKGISAGKSESSTIADLPLFQRQLAGYEQRLSAAQNLSQRANSNSLLASYLAVAQSHQATRNARQAFLDSFSDADSEALKCSQQSKCVGILQQQKTIPTFDIRALSQTISAPTRRFCAIDRVLFSGGFALFDELKAGAMTKSAESLCCMNIQSNLPADEAVMETLTTIGAKFLRRNLHSCGNQKNLETCLQKFNGVGCVGCTEDTENDCFSGTSGRERPLYGARTADLVLNTVMNNAEIVELVQGESRRLKASVRSVFCDKQAGGVSVDSNQYLDLQKKYLLEGSRQSYSLKSANRLVPVRTPEDRVKYQEQEAAREKRCRRYFE